MTVPTAQAAPESPRAAAPSARRGPLQAAVVGVVKGYQAMRSGHPSPCRFHPTCSAYAIEALELHGTWRGGMLALRRIGRCRPFGGHGIDLVPPVVAPQGTGDPR